MSLTVYNTLSRRKEPFEPLEPGKVGIYLCGPTVYKPSHIGHAVGPVVFDTIKRYLAHKGYQVRLIVNITDVDDKLIDEAERQRRPMADLAAEVEAGYLRAMEALGVRGVDAFPHATENIGRIVALIRRLVDKGAAYQAGGDVYFDHTAAADYGKLSGRRVAEAVTGTRDLAGQERRHPADFALWKASKEGEPAWDSPWGKGRPGWHIECSAMSMAILGETFDIHGGGLDLIFPHHENEIAQSETATGKKPFAKYWLHNGLTRISTRAASGEWHKEKMSKSLGNIRAISDLLEEFPAEAIRAFILSTHYRRPLDFSDEQIAVAAKSLETFYRLFERIARATGADPYAGGGGIDSVGESSGADADATLVAAVKGHRDRFFEAMDDDFNTAAAMAALHELAGTIHRYIDETQLETGDKGSTPAKLAAGACAALVQAGRLLGLFEIRRLRKDGTFLETLDRFSEDISAALSRRDNRLADSIQEYVKSISGITFRITGTQVQWEGAPSPQDRASDREIDRLVAERNAARKARDFAAADALRKKLAGMGITLEDTPAGTVWRKS